MNFVRQTGAATVMRPSPGDVHGSVVDCHHTGWRIAPAERQKWDGDIRLWDRLTRRTSISRMIVV
jgi:hypothetical protein